MIVSNLTAFCLLPYCPNQPPSLLVRTSIPTCLVPYLQLATYLICMYLPKYKYTLHCHQPECLPLYNILYRLSKMTRQSCNAVKFAVVMFTYTSLILKEKLGIILQQNCYSSLLSEGRAQCWQGWTAFSGPLTPSRTALIRDFHQWFCKDKASGAVRVIL